MTTNTTRRSLLSLGTGALAYGAGAAAVAGGLALAGEAKGAALQRISPALVTLLDQYHTADATLDRWYDAVWNPAVEAHRAEHQKVPYNAGREGELAQLQRQWDAGGYHAKEHELWAPIYAATDAILAFPVANALDLGAKLEHMERVGTCEADPEKYQQIICGDVRRLSGGQA